MAEIEDITGSRLAEFLKTRHLARVLVTEQELVSTNQSIVELAEQNAPEGLVLVADHQTGGRGRNGRSWFSPAGRNLYFTMLLRPKCRPGLVPQLAIVTALSLQRTLQKLCSIVPVVKWPNDIWVERQKMGGILCGMSCIGMCTEYVYVGIGLNVNLRREEVPEELRQNVTSVRMLTGHDWDRVEILAEICNDFEADFQEWLVAGSLSPFLERWRQFSFLDGREVRVEQGKQVLSGKADGITPEGLLILRGADGKVEYASAGDAHVIFSSIT